jgi:heme oxygenase
LTTSEKLKSYTWSNHQESEKLLIARMRKIRNKAQYIELLQLFYNYFGAIEAQISGHLGSSQLEDYQQRRKTDSLLNDILALGGTINKIIAAEDLPKFNNYFQAFGALYVLEGSTLGGPHISRMIQNQMDFRDNVGFTFFNGYGEQTESMWHKFKAVLDGLAENEKEENLILEAANNTFLKFRSWLEKQALLD